MVSSTACTAWEVQQRCMSQMKQQTDDHMLCNLQVSSSQLRLLQQRQQKVLQQSRQKVLQQRQQKVQQQSRQKVLQQSRQKVVAVELPAGAAVEPPGGAAVEPAAALAETAQPACQKGYAKQVAVTLQPATEGAADFAALRSSS